MADLEFHAVRRAAAYQQLHNLAHNPPITFDGAPPELGYGKWMAELQSAFARYERVRKFERRAVAETEKQATS